MSCWVGFAKTKLSRIDDIISLKKRRDPRVHKFFKNLVDIWKQKFEISIREPFLKIGITFESFKAEGNWPVEKERFTSSVKGYEISLQTSVRLLIEYY